jgi:hypothetical protein
MTISPDDEGLGSRTRPPPQALDSGVGELAMRLPPSLWQVRASIVAPGDWTELDLDPDTRHRSIRRAVRRAVARSRGLAPDAVPLIALLDQISRRADEARAFYCASLIIEDTIRGALVATVVMQVCESATAPLPGMLSLPVGKRCGDLVAVIRADPWWAGAAVGVIALPFVGPAVRLLIRDDGMILQYIAPLIGGLADVVLTFTCPCPPYAELMTDLFDAMAQSLELHYD